MVLKTFVCDLYRYKYDIEKLPRDWYNTYDDYFLCAERDTSSDEPQPAGSKRSRS